METTLQASKRASGHTNQATLVRGMAWGFIAGLAGTLLMDVILMGALSAVGLPAFTCFSIVGNTARRFFWILGVEMAGGVPLGVATHYLVGPMVGAIFGLALAKIAALRAINLKKAILLAVLYVEILSQPILATTPILLKMSAAEIFQWFGGSFVMHFIFALVLGVIVSYGLRLTSAGSHP